MKVSVTRPNILHNPFAPARPLVVDTEALATAFVIVCKRES